MSLITTTEMSALSRTSYADETKAGRFIDEAEQCDVRRFLGDALYCYITENIQSVQDLLNGCSYIVNGANRVHVGLKKTLAYYSYARFVVGGNVELTRVGVVNRNSDHSHHTDLEDRQQASREAASIADMYMSEVLDYCRNNDTLKSYVVSGTSICSNRTTIKIIGK